MDTERLARIAPRMKDFADRKLVAGTVTLLARNGRIAHFEAVGTQDAGTGKPMSKDSIFQIMSMTKPMVTTAITMLAEEGKLAISDPVEKHLPEYRGQAMVASRAADNTVTLKRPSRPITIRDLCTHTSGLPSQPPDGIFELPQKMDVPLGEAVLVYSQLALEFEPGTRWLYSNNGIATLGRIIEVASGQPFESFMKQRLWEPLGMADTFLFPPENKRERISANHATRDGKLVYADPKTTLGGEARQYRAGAKYPAPEWGAYSTASDLFAFYEMTRNGGLHQGRRVVSQASLEVATKVHTGEIAVGIGNGTGLGWDITRENAGTLNFLRVGTYGHGGAFGTHGWIDRESGVVGVFLVQGGAGAADAKGAFMRMANAAIIE
jgi:CubicO group peptidase (beta-lactamase class C family)